MQLTKANISKCREQTLAKETRPSMRVSERLARRWGLALSRFWEGLEPVELLGYGVARRNGVRHNPFIGP
jgi:hypothetical protein